MGRRRSLAFYVSHVSVVRVLLEAALCHDMCILDVSSCGMQTPRTGKSEGTWNVMVDIFSCLLLLTYL